jgi:hypothetical protein
MHSLTGVNCRKVPKEAWNKKAAAAQELWRLLFHLAALSEPRWNSDVDLVWSENWI